jgi:Tfp pilus assembly protein PilF
MKCRLFLLALLTMSAPFAIAQSKPKPKPKPKPAPTKPAKSVAKVTCSIADNAKVSGTITFEVTVQTESLVTKVEYWVGSDIRDTDASTPYEFEMDTLREKEGPAVIKFLVQTEDGQQVNHIVHITIDNGVGKGYAHWVKTAEENVVSGKWDDAIVAGRIALKIDDKSADAKLLLARAYFGKGVLDQAQRYAENVLSTEPENASALDLSSAINLRRAFRSQGVATDRKATLAAMEDALKKAAANRVKKYEAELGRLGTVSETNRFQLASTAMKAGRFGLAVDALRPAYEKDLTNSVVVNQFLYSLLRAGKFTEANTVAFNYAKRGMPDAEGYGLLAIVSTRNGDDKGAKEFERQAILNEANALGLRLAQIYLALWRDQGNTAQLVSALVKDEETRSETNYYQSNLLYKLGEFDRSRDAFETAVLAEPALYDLYIQQGAQALDLSTQSNSDEKSLDYYRSIAKVYFNTALAAKPESFEAFTGLALVAISENKFEDAVKFARLAVKAGPEYAAGYYALSVSLTREERRLINLRTDTTVKATEAQKNGLIEEANKLADRATELLKQLAAVQAEQADAVQSFRKFDKPNLEGQAIPEIKMALKYFIRYGRLPVLSLRNPS